MVTEDALLNKMAAYCAAAEHCRSEVLEKILKQDVPLEIAERIVDRLESEHYIDEARYCRAYANDKLRFSGWGKMKIRQGLYAKRIPDRLIVTCLDELDEAAYLDILKELIAVKRRSVKGRNEYEITAKLVRFAVGRGFELKDVYKFVREEDCDFSDY